MESLYAVSIYGTMLYIKGNLSQQECIAVETLAQHFQSTNEYPVDYESICQAFLNKVYNSLNLKLNQVPLAYVFRIK